MIRFDKQSESEFLLSILLFLGVIARHPEFLPYIEDQLTSEAIAKYFEHLFTSDKHVVERFESLILIFPINLYKY